MGRLSFVRLPQTAKVGHDGHFSHCCQNGKVQLDALRPLPEVLHDLLVGSDPGSRHFPARIREYNAALSFASFGADISFPPGHGPPVFRVHGAVYHASRAIEVDGDGQGKYAQLYLYDHGEALRARTAQNPDLRAEILDALQTMLEDTCPYAATYQHMQELVREATQAGSSVTLGFAADTAGDHRRYNQPTVHEVAAVFEGEEGGPPSNRDIVVWP